MTRRLALVLAGISLAWVPFSLTCSLIALAMGGSAVVPLSLLTIALNAVVVGINVITLTLVSPDHDTLHYPRRLVRRIAAILRRCFGAIPAAWLSLRQSRQDRRDMASEMARPTRRAWDVLTYPSHGMTDARRSRIEGLRFRSDIVADRLTGSIDIADVDALVLLDKTLGEVADAYARSLAVTTTDRERKAIDRRVEETLDQMLTAAETRLKAADVLVDQHLDTVLRHAQDSSRRLLDR